MGVGSGNRVRDLTSLCSGWRPYSAGSRLHKSSNSRLETLVVGSGVVQNPVDEGFCLVVKGGLVSEGYRGQIGKVVGGTPRSKSPGWVGTKPETLQRDPTRCPSRTGCPGPDVQPGSGRRDTTGPTPVAGRRRRPRVSVCRRPSPGATGTSGAMGVRNRCVFPTVGTRPTTRTGRPSLVGHPHPPPSPSFRRPGVVPPPRYRLGPEDLR